MGCKEFSKKRPWEGGWGKIFKIVNFLIISISIQKQILININSVTAYPPAGVFYFKPTQFKLSISFPKIWQKLEYLVQQFKLGIQAKICKRALITSCLYRPTPYRETVES